MSSVNQGNQVITHKYSTPLQAEYLNTLISGFSTEGLMQRPVIEVSRSSTGADVNIHQFSLLIEPKDKSKSYLDANGNYPVKYMVKVTVEQIVKLSITNESIAIGFTYNFDNSGVSQSQWYGDFSVLSKADMAEFDGVIIATCQKYVDSVTSERFYSVTTSGADICDALLREEGWNPQCWLSLISPRRVADDGFNKLELRKHNSVYSGYMSGHEGVCYFNAPTYTFDEVVNPTTSTVYGELGVLPYDWNAFNFTTEGLKRCNGGATIPIENPDGGVMALVDASTVNLLIKASTFANKLKLYPVMHEEKNIYIKDNKLYIR